MIARLHVLLPVWLTVPQGETFPIYEYADQDYRVRVFPPVKSDRVLPADRVSELRLDGVPAFRVDALRIDFQRQSFDRSEDLLFDPPKEVLGRAVNSFLIRLRYVIRAAAIRPLDFPLVTWRIQYLNDDESELEKVENLVRTRHGVEFSFSLVALNRRIWDDIQNLPVGYEPPLWEDLLLDAHGDLPRVGPAVVLAATALEVFSSHILNQLAAKQQLSGDLWNWISRRGDNLRDPTVEEQLDVLLKFFTGHSLKDDARLWESFKHLRTARNSFVHAGRASIGRSAISVETARTLVASAVEIVAKVRSWLPDDLQWPIFKHTVKLETRIKLDGQA